MGPQTAILSISGSILGIAAAVALLYAAATSLAAPASAPPAVSGIPVCDECRIIVVSHDQEAANFTTVQEAVAEAEALTPPPSQDDPVLIYVAPGTYDVGTDVIELPDFVSLQGAGHGVTTITGSATNDLPGPFENATIVLGVATGIRDVTIQNTGGSDVSIAVLGPSAGFGATIRNTVIRASGASQTNQALSISGAGAVNLVDSNVSAASATNANIAIRVADGAILDARNIDASGSRFTIIENANGTIHLRGGSVGGTGTGSDILIAIFTSGGTTEVRDVRIDVRNAAAANLGISASAGSTLVQGSYVRVRCVTCPNAINFGIDPHNVAAMSIDQTVIEVTEGSSTIGAAQSGSATLAISTSKIISDGDEVDGDASCGGVYDASLDPVMC